jgi:hypothetical protein
MCECKTATIETSPTTDVCVSDEEGREDTDIAWAIFSCIVRKGEKKMKKKDDQKVNRKERGAEYFFQMF